MHAYTGMLEFNCAQILLVCIARAALHALPVHIIYHVNVCVFMYVTQYYARAARSGIVA